MGEEVTTPASSRPGSSAARNRDAAKKRSALWKKQARSFKLKDVGKKVDAVRFCAQDERFFREQADVLPLLMGFLARTKTPELVMETLSAMHTLLSPVEESREDVADPGVTSENGDMHAEAIHPDVNAEFMLERSMDPESGWKAGEPFVNLFIASALAPDVRIKAIEVYDLLLRASVTRSTASVEAKATLFQFQSVGAPCSGLLGCLNVDDGELQFAALSCLRSLLRNPPDEAFLAAFQAEKGIVRILEFVSHSERRYHRPALDILESYSHFECGRGYLKENGAPAVLREAIQEAQGTMQATATSVTSGGMDASPLAAEDAPLLCSNISVICQIFVRVQFAQDQLKQAAEGSHREPDGAFCAAVIDAMLGILKYHVEHALSLAGGGTTESPRQPTGGAAAAAAATTAAANAAALASLLPFSSERCVALISSIGRMVEHSESCKMHAKANGLLPVLINCFKVKDEEQLHQVADKLLHLCVFIEDAGESQNHNWSNQEEGGGFLPEAAERPLNGDRVARRHTKGLRIDPQILCSVATGDSILTKAVGADEEVPITPDPASSGDKPPLVTVKSVISLLEASHAAGNKKLVFRHIRWLSVLVDLPGNGNALGENGIVLMLKILAETSLEETLLFAFLAKCIRGIVEQNAAALEICGNDNHDPSTSFFAFLKRTSSEVQHETCEEPAVTGSLLGDDETTKELELPVSEEHTADENMPDVSVPLHESVIPLEPISSLCKLEWIDENAEESAFLPMPLTEIRHDVDPFLCVAQALTGLATAFFKWNPTSDGPIGTDFSELIAHKLEYETAAVSGKAVAAAGGAGSKKKLHAELTKPPAVGETIFLCILEKGMQIPKLISQFAATNAAVCVSLLDLLNNVMTAPGGLKALLQLAKAELAAAIAAAAALTSDTGEEPQDASIPKPPIDEHASGETSWPMPPDKCAEMEHTLLLVPVMNVLQSPNTSFSEIEAAIRSIAVMMSDLKHVENEAATPPSSIAATSTIAAPEVPELVTTESDRFINVALGCGALVLLLSFMDHVRIPAGIDKSQDRASKMAAQIEELALKFVTLAQSKQEVMISKYRESLDLENPPPTSSTDDSSQHTPADPELPYQAQWAEQLLDHKFSAPRFGYASYSALLLASELALTKVVAALLHAGAAPDTASSDGMTPLMTAFLMGNEEMVQALIAAHANVNAITTDGKDLSVWNCALVSPFGVQVSDMITIAHATSSSNGGIPSMQSRIQLDTVSGAPRLMEMCLHSGMDANVSNSHGDFLLHALLSKALVRRKLRSLDVCFRYNSRSSDSTTGLNDIVVALIETYAADVNSCNHKGQTALHLALLYGHTGIVKLLLTHGANSNVQDKYGYLPLHYACFGFCSSADDGEERPVEIVKLLLEYADKYPLVRGVHADLRKHKSAEEKQALAIESMLDDGLQSVIMPRAITLKFASAPQILNSVSVLDNLLPWHFACGACSQLTSTLCLDDEQQHCFQANGEARSEILLYLIRECGVDVGITASKGMSGLHFAAKSDENGSNLAVIDVLLSHRNVPDTARSDGNSKTLNVNAVHEHTVINCLPVIPDGTEVTVLHCGHSGTQARVSSRSMDNTYHILLANGGHLSHVERENLQVSGTASATGPQHSKYLLLMESAFSALHYALQSSDDALALRLLSLPEISLEPEGSDLPLLALACAARCSPQVVEKLVSQQAGMRVHLPLRTAAFEPISAEVNPSLNSRKHETALHYAVMYEDLAVVRVLVSSPEGHVNVNVRRSGDGFTPLHLACEMGIMDIILLLLKHGANLLQLSTATSSDLANGVTPLHLLMIHDDVENQRLKALIEQKAVIPQMLLENLGDIYTPRKECTRDASQDDNQSLEHLSEAKAGTEVPDEKDNPRCILLDVEDQNLKLFERIQSLNHERQDNQEALTRRLEAELEKSDDILRTFFALIRGKTDYDPKDAISEPSDTQQSDAAPLMVILRKLPHWHECYRQYTTRSKWKPKPASTKMVRVGSLAKLPDVSAEQTA